MQESQVSKASSGVVRKVTKCSESGIEICAQIQETRTYTIVVSIGIVTKNSSNDCGEHVYDTCIESRGCLLAGLS